MEYNKEKVAFNNKVKDFVDEYPEGSKDRKA